ncbi:hypothetical protein PI124_g8405 [Phytophthora idaei]|nr:hypothetical protein PI124_g8405 [Phytophthora idaei]
MRYFYLALEALDAPGFAYGSSETEAGDVLEVRRLQTGRWKDMGDFSAPLPARPILRREVSEEEALSGLGAYVGGSVYLPRRQEGGFERWTYGVVTGYRWDPHLPTRALHVTTSEDSFDVVFDGERIQDLAVETYAMRLCEGLSVLWLMPAEMRALNEEAYALFPARGRAANRDVSAICRELEVDPVPEASRLPLLEIVAMEVTYVSVGYVLDFVFYKDGGRRLPPGLTLGDTIFDDPTTTAAEARLPEVPPGRARTKRPRILELDDSDDGSEDRRVRREYKEPPDARQLAQQLLDRAPAEAEGKAQFVPTRLQRTVHQAIVNGTYSMMGAQLFVERLQAHIELQAFLPHPAVLRGFYAWEFGTRGLSVMHIGWINTETRRRRIRESDMCDLSSRNSLPRPVRPSSLDDIISALDGLSLLVGKVFQSFVYGAVEAARKLFVQQKIFNVVVDDEGLGYLVFWVDERFECLRTRMVTESSESCVTIEEEFSVEHESYVQVHNAIQRRQFLQR